MKRLASILIILALMLSLTSICMADYDLSDFSNANIDWKKYEGTTIKVMLSEHWVSQAIIEKIPEFEELTGIKVSYESIPETDYRNKLLIEFNAGSNPPDVIMENYGFIATDVAAGWADDLYPYINNAEVTDPAFYDFDDIMPDSIEYAKIGDVLPGIPITADRVLLMYRKDLLEEKGIAVPTTFDELYEAAVALNDPANNISGFEGRLKRSNGAAHVWATYLYSFGGEGIVQNPDGTVSCYYDTPEAIKAAEYYAKILRDAGPQGAVNYGWSECLSDFQAGNAAIYADNSSFMGQVEDPSVSQVAGKVGYAPMPTDGEHPSKVHINHWMLGICGLGKNKDAGWYFVQWASSKPVVREIAMDNGNSARTSCWTDPEFVAKYGEDYVKASMGEPGTGCRWCVPQVDEMLESMDSIDIGLQRILTGEDSETVMKTVQSEHEAFLGIK